MLTFLWAMQPADIDTVNAFHGGLLASRNARYVDSRDCSGTLATSRVGKVAA